MGPFDILTIQRMFYRGSISNKARYREDGSSEPWRMITAGFPQWGKGRDTAVIKRADRKLMARAGRQRKPRHFRSKPLGWACFAVAILLWVMPFAFIGWMHHVMNINSVRRIEEERKQAEKVETWNKAAKELEKSNILLPLGRPVEPPDHSEQDKALEEATRTNGESFFLWITLPGSALLFWWGRRLRSLSAETLLAQDSRPPVVYFRSFQDDLKFLTPLNTRSGIFGTNKYRTEEEQIVKQLKRIGPVVAIGDPNETIPLAGASRLYTANDTWHEVAEQLLASAALVVFRFGTSPGLVWEIKRGRNQIPPERFVLLIPRSKDDVLYAARYSRFREQISDVLNLPETPESPIISFRADWAPETFGKGYSRFYKRLRDFVSSRVAAAGSRR